jgi:hypothetical protein
MEALCPAEPPVLTHNFTDFTSWSRVLSEITVSYLVNQLPVFYVIRLFLAYSQQHTTYPCSLSDVSSLWLFV